MASSMKTMNMMMPIMSAIFCYSMPAGMGLYWIAGSVVRSVQQVVINKHIDKMDLNELIEKNQEKAKKKMEKAGAISKNLNNYATMNTKNVVPNTAKKSSMTQEERDAAMKKASEYYGKDYKAGSLASKANMGKQYNEKNNKK